MMQSSERREIGSVAIVGAGYMGAQIALQCAFRGFPVLMIDTEQIALNNAIESQRQELLRRLQEEEIQSNGVESVLRRISHSLDLGAVSDSDLVIETIPENLDAKRKLFAQLDGICSKTTILATNSSSIRASRIEDVVSYPNRILNLHFYPPIWDRSLAELMGGTSTSRETFEAARRFVESLGLVPILVRRESTGFVFNRVWRAIKKECLRVVDEGVATYEDVDRAWMLLMDHPIGPFGLMDRIGLDVVRDIEMVYYLESKQESDKPPRVLEDKVAAGELGLKTGRGFYFYPHPAFERPGFLKQKGELAHAVE
jgi:3-hydroxybutyryl-CoA dehydrogenase